MPLNRASYLELFKKLLAPVRRMTEGPGGGGVLDLNLYGDVPTKKIFFHPALEFSPSNDTLFWKKSLKSILKNTKI